MSTSAEKRTLPTSSVTKIAASKPLPMNCAINTSTRWMTGDHVSRKKDASKGANERRYH
jgi:hypothetical protein